MKSRKSIAVLTFIVGGIVAFWLYPGINKANNTLYERVYEDTSHKDGYTNVLEQTRSASDTSVRRVIAKQKFIKQALRPIDGVKKLEVEMFSRAVHFNEIPMIIKDSVVVVDQTVNVENEISVNDTTTSLEIEASLR